MATAAVTVTIESTVWEVWVAAQKLDQMAKGGSLGSVDVKRVHVQLEGDF